MLSPAKYFPKTTKETREMFKFINRHENPNSTVPWFAVRERVTIKQTV